jgi:DUF917 family protein
MNFIKIMIFLGGTLGLVTPSFGSNVLQLYHPTLRSLTLLNARIIENVNTTEKAQTTPVTLNNLKTLNILGNKPDALLMEYVLETLNKAPQLENLILENLPLSQSGLRKIIKHMNQNTKTFSVTKGSINDIKFTASIRFFETDTKIETLNFSYNNLENPLNEALEINLIKTFPNLKVLNLENNQISNLAPFTKLAEMHKGLKILLGGNPTRLEDQIIHDHPRIIFRSRLVGQEEY